MNNAEINYLSSESVCRLFSFEQDKDQSFINGYNIRRDRLAKELLTFLDEKNQNSLSKKNFLSTDENVIKIKKTSASTSLDVLYRVKVLNMISCKEVISNILTSKDLKETLSRGKKVDVIISNSNKELKISLPFEKGTSYLDMIESISNEINNCGFKLNSKIVYENRKKDLKLHIKGENGKDNDFNIEIKGDELLKNTFDFEVIKSASDYVYEIAGKKYTSKEKDVNITKNLKVTLVNVGDVDIISTFDVEEVMKDLSKVVSHYNILIDYLIDNKNYTVVSKELNRYKDSFNSIVYELSTLGIDISLNLRMSIDKKRMKKKILNDPNFVKKMISKDAGLFDKLFMLLKTSNIDINHISRNNGQKAMVINMLDKVNGKTISHEPYYMIGDNKLE